ncbi:hypothetical protein [Actinomadura sp. SCN-SB]|uniref:iron-sulfur cluster-binding protein n=1 Tax=Actinomadura sp. SCN-SB TaxID=3373092 RepID=UPI0037512FAF
MPGDERYRSWAMAGRAYEVVSRRSAAPGEMTLTLRPDHGHTGHAEPAVAALPGQYWVLRTATGMRLPVVGAHAPEGPLELTTVRMPCGPPPAQVGERVMVRGPFGSGWDLEIAVGRTVLCVAWESRLGLLRSAADQLIASRPRHAGLRIWVGGRTPPAASSRADLSRWALRGADVTVVSGGDVAMTEAVRQLDFPPEAGVALLAGPLPMMKATAEALVRHGVPAGRIQLATHRLIRCTNGRCGNCRVGGKGHPLFACQSGPVIGYDLLTAPSQG